MGQIVGFECLICGKIHSPDTTLYVCPDHGDDGILDVRYDYDRIRTTASREDLMGSGIQSMWRYLELLPVDSEQTMKRITGSVLGTVGWTPLLHLPQVGNPFGLRDFWIKDDSRQPTASLKDRASAIAAVKARELGFKTVTTASTGNAAAALACMSAAVSMENVIFVPESTPQAKIAQLLVFGSHVLLVQGSYDDAFELCLKAAAEFGWYNRNTGYNPLMTEGKKTAAFEICEQLGWHPPDVILIPVGDGCILGGIHKGLRDLLTLGWIDRMPRLIGVQAAGSAALAEAWKRGEDPCTMKPIQPQTVADSISAGLPRDRIKAMKGVRETRGAFITVTDEEIISAIPELARRCGVFAEPAGAASFAGLIRAVKAGLIECGESAVALVTGSGLKDVKTVMQALPSPPVISPDLDDVRRELQLHKKESRV
jgi:threonine synthase